MTANIAVKRKFEVEDLFRFEFINEAQLSPDGKKVAYVLMRIDEQQNKEFKSLWLIDLLKESTSQLTFGDNADYSPVWSPDGHSFAFLSDRCGKTQIFQFDIDTGQSFPITDLEQGCGGSLIWSPDGQKLTFTAVTPQPVDLTKPYRINRTIYRRDGAELVDNLIKQVYVLDLKTGEIKQLTQAPCNHYPTAWSPEGDKVLILTNLAPDDTKIDPSLDVVDLEGRVQTILPKEWGRIDHAVWLKNGQIAFAGLPAGNPAGTKNDLFVMDADGRGIECRTSSLENVIDGSFHADFPVDWPDCPPPILSSEDGSEAVICLQSGGELHLVRISLQGEEKIETIAAGERFCYPFNRIGNKVIFGYSTLFDPTQLALLDLSSGIEHTLTSLNAGLLCEIEQPEVKNIHFLGSDGIRVEGWLMLPSGTPPFPTVLHIHGGPHAAYGHVFQFDYLTLVGAGYAVLFINHRGSTGYGNDFATATRMDWGNLDYQDLMAGVDHTITLGLVDADALGCCGVSGGGNLTCWIIGHTDRFKAAVPENPLTSFTSMYGTSDIGLKFVVNEMGGTPLETPEVYKRCSPLTYAHQCNTPTLLIIGERDHRTPPEQVEQFYAVLKANGCTAEMLRFPGGSHGGSAVGDMILRRTENEALLDWFDRYLK